MVESTECQEYFNNPDNRMFEMVHFLDLYGRKFRYMNMDNTNMSSTQIMEQLSIDVGELDEEMYAEYNDDDVGELTRKVNAKSCKKQSERYIRM